MGIGVIFSILQFLYIGALGAGAIMLVLSVWRGMKALESMALSLEGYF